MKNLRFLGASGVVTGSSILLTGSSGDRILIDFGMFQGIKKIEEQNHFPLSFDPKSIGAVFLTHAHLDHCGRLPVLIKNGYSGKIYATKPTIDIAHISLLDSAKIAQNEKGDTPLYTREDVNKTYDRFEPVSYDKSFRAGEFTVMYHDAGHILGSSYIEIFDENSNRIVFSGDLGNTPQDLIKPTSYISKADYVVMESTYGDRTHTREDVQSILQNEINIVEKDKAILLIPAFSIERTQEILHRIYHLKKDKKVDTNTPVFLDSPMAIAVTDVFKHYRNLYNQELLKDERPFDFPGLHLTKTVDESKTIEKVEGAKVIIAGSGMMSGGRILKHLKLYASNSSTRICIVGYQAVDTLGRKVEEKAKHVIIDNQSVSVNATVTKIESLSSHADQPKLLEWLKHISRVKRVFLVHGEDSAREILRDKIIKQLSIDDIKLPLKNEEYSLLNR